MPKINQLSPHVADLIAAGEVVERPGSVVKELLENAIDAGAQHITVEIKDGGMTFIRLCDDGCGMAPEDARIAFLRHATSKIKDAADLAAIQTLGFRGEALAAISSVSKIDLLTRTADAPAGTSLHLEAGKITRQDEAGCPPGTTIIVRDLFYNTPARMKFMKSDAAEGAFIFAAVQKQALAHPALSICFIRDGQELLRTPGDGQLHSAIYSVWGRELAGGMLPVHSMWENMQLDGFVTKPTVTRGNRNYEAFFVNGRYIKSRLLSAALEDAYQNQIMVGRMPGCVLHLQLPPHLVDVNVHPAKTEVRFLSERAVSDCIRYGVLATLNRAPGRVEMHLPQAAPTVPAQPKPAGSAKPAAPQPGFQTMSAEAYRALSSVRGQTPSAAPAQRVLQAFAEQAESSAPLHSQIQRPATQAAQAAHPAAPLPRAPQSAPIVKPVAAPASEAAAKPAPAQAPALAEPEAQQALPTMAAPADYRVVGEVLRTYIIVEQGDTVLFIDKHAAHERILFERLKKNPNTYMGQRLLTPLTYRPDQEEAALLLEHRTLLLELGYEVEDFGGGTLAIRQVPSEISADDAIACLSELAERLKIARPTDSLRDDLLHTIACKAAINAGWHTEAPERDALVREVLSRDDLKYCPHGRPICMTLRRSQLERQFKRA